jgi:hypothetical protein
MTVIRTTTPARTYNPRGGWDERRTHKDGYSLWRNGELHCSNGFAVVRDDRHEAWLFGNHLETPGHPENDPLTFGGQTKSGKVNWVDGDLAIRAVTRTNASDVEECRWYDHDGDPATHWSGGYHVRRVLATGEKRYYRQVTAGAKPLLHRVDGPAIEDAENPVRSIWCLEGARVDGPLELLIKHTMRAQKAAEHGRPIVRLDLTDAEKSRLRITVITHPETPLASDIAIAFPDEFHAALTYLNED